MRRFLAILLCKLANILGKLLGHGSSLPGSIALKVCPDVLGHIKYPDTIIAVTGSNGKSSTVEMIAAVLEADGKRVVCNREGSNQIQGVVTAVLVGSTFGGRLKADVLLLESDERYTVYSFKHFHPTHLVVTDLFRDQLTRNGHAEWVYDCLVPAMHPDTTLILNADDPLSSCLAENMPKVKWFGMANGEMSSVVPTGIYRDGSYCPICKKPMSYDWYHFNQMGSYHCDSCGHRRPQPDFEVTGTDADKAQLVINDKTAITLAFFSVYSIYNCAAAFAACSLAGVSDEVIASVIGEHALKNGRIKSFKLKSRKATLLISKHENSIAYDTNLRYICGTGRPCEVMIVVDAISRKYFTSETSWLWDIDFGVLAAENVKKIHLTGRYAKDLLLRFSFTDMPEDKIICTTSVQQGLKALEDEGEDVYIVTCFSDEQKVVREGEQK